MRQWIDTPRTFLPITFHIYGRLEREKFHWTTDLFLHHLLIRKGQCRGIRRLGYGFSSVRIVSARYTIFFTLRIDNFLEYTLRFSSENRIFLRRNPCRSVRCRSQSSFCHKTKWHRRQSNLCAIFCKDSFVKFFVKFNMNNYANNYALRYGW